jgi:hypothetical protein
MTNESQVGLPFGGAGCLLVALSPLPRKSLQLSHPSNWLLFKIPLFLPGEIYRLHMPAAHYRRKLGRLGGLISILTACCGLVGVGLGLSWAGTSFAWDSPAVISSLTSGSVMLFLAFILLLQEAKVTGKFFNRCFKNIGQEASTLTSFILCRSLTGVGFHV